MQKKKIPNIVDIADVIRDLLPICAGAKKGLYNCKDCFGIAKIALDTAYFFSDRHTY